MARAVETGRSSAFAREIKTSLTSPRSAQVPRRPHAPWLSGLASLPSLSRRLLISPAISFLIHWLLKKLSVSFPPCGGFSISLLLLSSDSPGVAEGGILGEATAFTLLRLSPWPGLSGKVACAREQDANLSVRSASSRVAAVLCFLPSCPSVLLSAVPRKVLRYRRSCGAVRFSLQLCQKSFTYSDGPALAV